jgi:stage V sporulation protein AC
MISKLNGKEYRKYADAKTPRTKILRNSAAAFLVGGLICAFGQAIGNLYMVLGMDRENAASLTSITLIFTGALLTGLNLYDDIGRFAGAGSIVPITGFANSIVSPAMEYKSEGYVMGVGARMFIIAGPVLVYGISASIAIGLLHHIFK